VRDAYGRRTRPGVTSGIIWTSVVHVVGAVVLMAAARPQEIAPPVYAVELVAAPRTPPKPRRAPEATPRQVDPPPEAPAKAEARKDDSPAPVPVPVKQETEPPPKTAPTEQPLPPPPTITYCSTPASPAGGVKQLPASHTWSPGHSTPRQGS